MQTHQFIFGYGRVSSKAGSDGRSRQETSVELQDASLRDYIARTFPAAEPIIRRERHTGAFEFGDIRKRPEGALLWAAMTSARQLHPAAEIHLVVTKVDRLGRGWLEGQILLHQLEILNIFVHFVDLGGRTIDTRDFIGRKMISDLLWMAEMEVRLIQGRIQTVIDHKFASEEIAGSVPYGWDAEATGQTTGKGVPIRRKVDNLGEQKEILWMLAQRERHGYHTVAKKLNARGVPTKNSGDVRNIGGPGLETRQRIVRGKWTAAQVRKILLSRTVTEWLNKEAMNAGEKAA